MLPLVDVAPLLDGSDVEGVARRLDAACRRVGFVRIAGHGVPADLHAELLDLGAQFFALPYSAKAEIAMARAGRAWRGWFPLGGELTSGRPDGKEGLYFGEELAADDPAVVAGTPLHGPNLFPTEPARLRPAVLTWMAEMTGLGQALLGALAVALGLDQGWFARTVTTRPTTLLRIFHYPAGWTGEWGVAEHTDYGLLTILAQDGTAGLEVRGPDGWTAVPPDPSLLVVNLGDMLERLTRGLYRSTPHRVRNTAESGRISMPFFLDPSWDAEPVPLESLDPTDVSSGPPRWDGADVHAWYGRYGDYLTAKVARVFPDLLGPVRSAGRRVEPGE